MKLNPDGSCPACIGGWLCAFHEAEGLQRDREKSAVIQTAAKGIQERRIEDVYAALSEWREVAIGLAQIEKGTL